MDQGTGFFEILVGFFVVSLFLFLYPQPPQFPGFIQEGGGFQVSQDPDTILYEKEGLVIILFLF